MPLRSRSTAVGLSFAVLFGASVAQAEASHAKNGCADDAERGQALRDERKLVDARALFLRCSQVSCPIAVRRECARWLDEVTSRLPTIVPSARDENGNDLPAVRVSLDGALLASTLDGSAFPLDPGSHALHFENGAGATAEVTLVVREGEQRRIVEATLKPTPSRTALSLHPLPLAPEHHTPPLAYAAGGVGIVALGIATYAGIRGIADYQNLSDTCAPTCPHDDVTAVRTKLWVSTVAGAVGVAALATAIVVTVSSKTKSAAWILPLVPLGGAAAGATVGARIAFD